MKTIYKYELRALTEQSIKLPKGAQILDVQVFHVFEAL